MATKAISFFVAFISFVALADCNVTENVEGSPVCQIRLTNLDNIRNSFLTAEVVPSLFNNSNYLFFLAEIQSVEVLQTLEQQFVNYERLLCNLLLESDCFALSSSNKTKSQLACCFIITLSLFIQNKFYTVAL